MQTRGPCRRRRLRVPRPPATDCSPQSRSSSATTTGTLGPPRPPSRLSRRSTDDATPWKPGRSHRSAPWRCFRLGPLPRRLHLVTQIAFRDADHRHSSWPLSAITAWKSNSAAAAAPLPASTAEGAEWLARYESPAASRPATSARSITTAARTVSSGPGGVDRLTARSS